MSEFRVSPRGGAYFCLSVALFGIAMMLDGGTGRLSVLWTAMVWAALIAGSLILIARFWTARHDPKAVRKIQAQGAYGLLPAKLRHWLFS